MLMGLIEGLNATGVSLRKDEEGLDMETVLQERKVTFFFSCFIFFLVYTYTHEQTRSC